MTQQIRLASAVALVVALAAPAGAQQTAETRPATTTTSGDTGLWFVPTAEILPAKKWSLSAYRVNFDYEQGFTDVSNFPVTFAFGVRDRVELFGALTAVNRIDRDTRPLYSSSAAGGTLNEYPFVNDGWTGSNLGDLWLGAKINLTSQHRRQPAALALRGMLKVPTASEDKGAGTGKPDFALDAIVSGEANQRVELSAFGGFIVRGDPDDFDLLNGIRWGAGAAMPTRKHLRLTAELHGEHYLGDAVDRTGPVIQIFPLPPTASEQKGPINAALGLTWQRSNGFFVGTGINWNLRISGRSDFGAEDETGDALGFQFRIGYHPGVRQYVEPAPIKPTEPEKPVNRPPSVRAQCQPCTVEVGATATVSATATDPDNDPLTYRWSAVAGTLQAPTAASSRWTAPMQEGTVVFTVEVEDGQGGRATDAVTITVVRPKEVIPPPTFEDVHFDFDRYSLRPEATRKLDEAVTAMQKDPTVRIQIEGHTCNIGTSEYNLALGDRRAASVREYLTSRGISADRMTMTTFGEEKPLHSNAREETRRLNRRAALVVRVVR